MIDKDSIKPQPNTETSAEYRERVMKKLRGDPKTTSEPKTCDDCAWPMSAFNTCCNPQGRHGGDCIIYTEETYGATTQRTYYPACPMFVSKERRV